MEDRLDPLVNLEVLETRVHLDNLVNQVLLE